MSLDRRRFLALLGAGAIPGCSAPASAPGGRATRATGSERSPRTVWESRIGGFFAINRPAVAGDTLVVQSDANVYALDMETGTERWATDVGSRPNYFSPAVREGSTFVTSTHRGGTVYALSVDAGEVLWSVGGGLVTSPTTANGRVYVSGKESGDCVVRAVSADDGSEAWTVRIGGEDRCSPAASPVVRDGRVFAAVNLRGEGAELRGVLYVLDAEDGTRLWTYPVDGGIDATPAVADGTVFLPASDGGALRAVDVESRTESWAHERRTSNINYWTPPQVADGRVYASNIGGITAFDAAGGTVEWNLRRNLISRNGLTVADGTVYTAGKWLAALSADDGTVRWLFKREEMASTAFSAPAVRDGVAYVGGCLKRRPEQRYFHVVEALR